MNRVCDLCGTEFRAEDYICPSCGNDYSPDGVDGPLVIGPPTWGRIAVGLIPQGEGGSIIELIKKILENEERLTQQSFLSGQAGLLRSKNEKVILYGPMSTFIEIKKKLAAAAYKTEIIFEEMEIKDVSEIIRDFNDGAKTWLSD